MDEGRRQVFLKIFRTKGLISVLIQEPLWMKTQGSAYQ